MVVDKVDGGWVQVQRRQRRRSGGEAGVRLTPVRERIETT